MGELMYLPYNIPDTDLPTELLATRQHYAVAVEKAKEFVRNNRQEKHKL